MDLSSGVWSRCDLKKINKVFIKVQKIGALGFSKVHEDSPLLACEKILGFSPLSLWIRKVTLKATCSVKIIA